MTMKRRMPGPGKREILFVPSKRRYVRGDRPDVDCIFCAVLREDERVSSLLVVKDRLVFVTFNLFPYNPGHVMVVPRRHIVDPRERTEAERRAMDRWTDRLLGALDRMYAPAGYNIGYNIGPAGGASLEHLHIHIVPRFRNEIGFIDVIGGARVHVDDPVEALAQLRALLK